MESQTRDIGSASPRTIESCVGLSDFCGKHGGDVI